MFLNIVERLLHRRYGMRVKAVANAILQQSFNEEILVNPFKLQKIMYYVYRDYLKATGKSLFEDYFEVWKWGPVVKSIYDEFKGFGSNPITRYATEDDGETSYIVSAKDKVFWDILNVVWNKTKAFTGFQLAEYTHEPNGAWERTKNDGNLCITDEYIKEDVTFYE